MHPFRFPPSLLATALFALSPAMAEDYSLWPDTLEFFLDTSPSGAEVTGAVTGFPVLVRLDKQNFDFSRASSKGTDIRLSDGAGRHLPYQVDHWDSAGGKAAVWVKADTVRGNQAGQPYRIHFGRRTAPDSSRPAAVFDSADGFVAVWHMGAGPDGVWGNRANSVAGGMTAVPNGYDGDESVPGHIGLCDSLSNEANDEDYLTLGDGYEKLAAGFSYSAWVHPTAAANWARLLDLGNGAGLDNVAIGRHDSSNALFFDVYNSNLKSASVNVDAAFAQDQWQLIDITVSGTSARVYRNGALVRLDTLTQTISPSRRAYNYIGKSNWAGDAFFRGRMDEVRISRTARGADWIKLSHANQKANQDLVSFERPVLCAIRFAVPSDTSLPEGSLLELSAAADCATSFSWTPVEGPAPRLLDPDVKVLQVRLPRVSGDTSVVYRFSAVFPDSVREKEVRVTVRESVPDPLFALPAPRAWDGKDSLLIEPVISNLAAIKASRDSVLRWAWTLEGAEADTAWMEGGLLLRKPMETGTAKVGLCLDNGGARACRQMEVEMTGMPTGLVPKPAKTRTGPDLRARDANGRLRPAGRLFRY